jgi:purine-binding chemotaxis protein CheW
VIHQRCREAKETMARDNYEPNDSDAEDEDDNIDNTYLTFAVAGEEFALHVAHVTEIVRLQKIFAVPDVATYIRGVINLRGKVIPLLDVRARFGVEQVPYTDRTVVVVIEVGDSATGLVVDRVFDITEIAPQNLEPAPATTHASRLPLVTSMSKQGDRVSFIIDVETLVNAPPFSNPTSPGSGPTNARERDKAA